MDSASVVVALVLILFVGCWVLAFCVGDTSKKADEQAREMMEKRARDQGRS